MAVIEKDYLTSGEAAKILRCSRKTIRRWAKKGNLPHTTTLGGHFRFSRADILDVLEILHQARQENDE